jgi:3-oxoacyl-[acyl-carrier protein] reductase
VDLKLRNKVFLISGSSRGIGNGIARVLLEEGAKVVLTGRKEEDLMKAVHESEQEYPRQVLHHCGDLWKGEVLQSLEDKVISHWSEIHGIVANVGGVRGVPDVAIDEDDWNWYLKYNFEIAVKFAQHFIPSLTESKGSIVFIGSIAGLEDVGAPIPYNVGKAAIEVYSKSLSRRLGKSGVRVNTVSPGNVIFEGGNWDLKRRANKEAIDQMIDEKVPLDAFGSPDDIGNIVAFLLSSKAKFITGSSIVADGGQTIGF